jgi:CheY-like chemotaxis protein
VQIVENLVGNALKHTPAGRRIRVGVRAAGATAELKVEDEGSGIRPELLPNVFEPFQQGEQGLDRSAGGLGLGLTLVRRLTELHGGSVEAHSDGIGRGSAFVLRFPVSPAAARSRAAAGDRQATLVRRRVLIIEDNVDARQTLRALLEMFGHEVHEAGDGETGIATALAVRPDVVLVDIGLPHLDGYEVARRLRREHASMRLVALTGYGRDDDVRGATEAGFDEHLLKPASADRLRAAIDAASPAARGALDVEDAGEKQRAGA